MSLIYALVITVCSFLFVARSDSSAVGDNAKVHESATVITVCLFLFVASSDSLAVGDNAKVHESASPIIHQQLFRLIAVNNRMRTSRLGRVDQNEGLNIL